jgi:hypothetical protein
VLGYPQNPPLPPAIESLLAFHSHAFYRTLRIQCDASALLAYLRRPVRFTNTDVIGAVAFETANTIHEHFKVCRPSSDGYHPFVPAWYETTVLEFVDEDPEDIFDPGMSRKVTLTLGQKFLFLLALFISEGSTDAIRQRIRASTSGKTFCTDLHWFVMLVHYEDLVTRAIVPLGLPDWELPERFKHSGGISVLRCFEPFFDVSSVLRAIVEKNRKPLAITLDHCLLMMALLPLRLAESEGIHHAGDCMSLLRSGMRILVTSFAKKENVWSSKVEEKDEVWYTDFNPTKMPFLERWLRTMDALSTTFAEITYRVQSNKASWNDVSNALAPVSSEAFIGFFKEILKWLPYVDFSALRAPAKGLTEKRVRMESDSCAWSLLMGKRIPDAGLLNQWTTAVAQRSKEIPPNVFIIENASASQVSTAYNTFFNSFWLRLHSMQSITADNNGNVQVQNIVEANAVKRERFEIADFFDKTTNSYSTFVVADAREFWMFCAFQHALRTAVLTGASKYRPSVQSRADLGLFFASLLRLDAIAKESIAIRPDPRDATKYIRRMESYMPVIHPRYDGTLPVPTPFDYLFNLIPMMMGRARGDHSIDDDVRRNRRAVVHIVRLMSILRDKKYHKQELEANPCVRNSILVRLSSRSMQAMAWTVLAMGFPVSGYPKDARLYFHIALCRPVVDLYSTTIQGPRLEWTAEQKALIAKAEADGRLAMPRIASPRIGLGATDNVDFMRLTSSQVSQICHWFETRDSAGKWSSVVADPMRQALFWAVYANISVCLPCSAYVFEEICGTMDAVPVKWKDISDPEWTNASTTVWPDKKKEYLRPDVGMDEKTSLLPETSRDRVDLSEDCSVEPYYRFAMSLAGVQGSELCSYFPEIEDELYLFNEAAIDALHRGQLASPISLMSSVYLPVMDDSIHPLFESLKCQEKILNATVLQKFVSELCRTRNASPVIQQQAQNNIGMQIESPTPALSLNRQFTETTINPFS